MWTRLKVFPAVNGLHVCYPDLCPTGLNARISLSQLYGSSSAVSVVSQALCHMTMTRALFCRDLLILQKLYLRFGDNVRQHTLVPSMFLIPFLTEIK